MNDDVRKELYKRFVTTQADVDQKRQDAMIVAEKVYGHPRNAVVKMMKYSGKYDDKALVERLEKKPEAFGPYRGSFLSGAPFSLQSLRDKAVAKDMVTALPGLIKEVLDADNKLDGIKRAMADAGMTQGPPRGKGGIDFT